MTSTHIKQMHKRFLPYFLHNMLVFYIHLGRKNLYMGLERNSLLLLRMGTIEIDSSLLIATLHTGTDVLF